MCNKTLFNHKKQKAAVNNSAKMIKQATDYMNLNTTSRLALFYMYNNNNHLTTKTVYKSIE